MNNDYTDVEENRKFNIAMDIVDKIRQGYIQAEDYHDNPTMKYRLTDYKAADLIVKGME